MDYKRSRLGYYADFATVPVAILAMCVAVDRVGVNLFGVAGMIVVGFVLWTFAEYWIHRIVFHHVMMHDHAAHHRRPGAFIGASPWLTISILSGLWVGLPYLIGMTAGGGFFIGLAIGYMCYIVLHDRFHHAARLRVGSRLWKLYHIHAYHHSHPRSNFGVISPAWDIVFGTYCKPLLW